VKKCNFVSLAKQPHFQEEAKFWGLGYGYGVREMLLFIYFPKFSFPEPPVRLTGERGEWPSLLLQLQCSTKAIREEKVLREKEVSSTLVWQMVNQCPSSSSSSLKMDFGREP
jgi:hypothetical protein